MSIAQMITQVVALGRERHSIIHRYHIDRAQRSLQHFAHWAYDHVPFYRESFSSASELYAPRPLLDQNTLTTQRFRLFPFTKPLYGTEEYMHPLRIHDGMLTTLLLSGHYMPHTPLFEIQAALLDLPFLVPFRQGRRYTLLSPDAITNPLSEHEQILNGDKGPDDRHYLQTMKTYNLLGTVNDLTSWLTQISSSTSKDKSSMTLPQQLFARLSCTDLQHETNRQAVYEMKVLETKLTYYPVLFELHLGYFGAYVPECQHYHLNWRHVQANNSTKGVVFTRLTRYGPILLHYRPIDVEHLRVRLCPSHHSPILVSINGSIALSSISSKTEM